MQKYNLKLVQTFLSVAELGSLRKAAEASARSPSAISMQIKDLEEQIGVQLFVRARQRVQLTKDGQALYEDIAGSVNLIEDGLKKLRRKVDQRRGLVTLACAPTMAAQGVGETLTRFLRKFPNTMVRMKEAPPDEGADLLRSQSAEFYVGPQASTVDDFSFEPMLSERIYACIPRAFDKGQHSTTLAEIADYPLILLDGKTSVRRLIDTIARSKQINLQIRFELQSAHTGLALAELGVGVALLPEIALGLGRFENCRVVPITDPEAVRSVGVTRLKGQVLHNYSTLLLDLLKERFSEEGWPSPLEDLP